MRPGREQAAMRVTDGRDGEHVLQGAAHSAAAVFHLE